MSLVALVDARAFAGEDEVQWVAITDCDRNAQTARVRFKSGREACYKIRELLRVRGLGSLPTTLADS